MKLSIATVAGKIENLAHSGHKSPEQVLITQSFAAHGTSGTTRLAGAFVVATLFAISTASLPGSAAETTGQITEFVLPAGDPGHPPQPNGIAAGADGNLWVAETGINKIARVTPGGAITEFPVPGGVLPSAVTAGPDGNMWFAQRGGVGSITPAGVATIYKVDGIISSICPGPDGNLWFTENFRGKIGRATPSGQITLFNIPTRPGAGGQSINPLTIAAGPDGNLWFTESHHGANKIGRITTAGEITEFPLPTAGSPSGITAGPDGNLWFLQGNYPLEDRVARITTAGVITEYALASLKKSQSTTIVSGPDGNLWFTERNNPNNKVARVTPVGELKEFQVPTAFSGPSGLAVGPDGNLWFTESGKGKVGRLHTAATNTQYVLHLASGFAPEGTTIELGQSVQWINEMPGQSTVQHAGTPPIFDSPSQGTGSRYTTRFAVAGTYAYLDRLHPSHQGTVTVSMRIAPETGFRTNQFVATWATGPDPVVSGGWVIDVQVATPGVTNFASWQDGVTTRSAAYVPTSTNGVYRFRTRLRHANEPSASDWSPVVAITVR